MAGSTSGHTLDAMAEEQRPGAGESSEGDAVAGEQRPGAGESSEGDAVAGEQRPGAGESSEGDTTRDRKLCRSSTDKVIAGVAGGIGAYFGIDSVIVRIAFIVLTFLGGAGPFLYLIGWLALPQEDSPSVIAKALGSDSPRRFRSLMAVVLIGIGLLITASLSGELFATFINVWTMAPYLALILIAAGVALVLWPGPTGRSKPTPAPSPPPSAPSPPAPHPSTAAAGGPGWAAASPAGPVPSPVVPVRRRGRTMIGYLTVAVLLVYTGGSMVLDRLDAVEVDIGVYLAVALAITGVGLLVSAYLVSARGLILLGVVLSAPLLLFAGAELPWGSGVGKLRVDVMTASELQDEYHHGVGQMVVDLSDLEADGTVNSLDLSVSVGELDIYVPDNIKTTADVNVGAGSIRVWYGGPEPDRQRDLGYSRRLLEDLLRLPLSYTDGSGSDADIGTIEDYLDDYERYREDRIPPHQRESLLRLVAEGSGVGDETDLREVFRVLLAEARYSGYPWEGREEGLGLARQVTTPVWGDPESELRLDIDMGIGSVEIVTLPAMDRIGATGQ